MGTPPPDSQWGSPPPPPPPPPAAYAPAYPSAYQGGQGPGAIGYFRNLRGLAIAMYVVLTIAGALGLVMIPVAINERRVVHDHAFGSFFTGAAAVRDANRAIGGVAGLLFMVSLAISVLFMIWMWRAAKNVGLFGRARQKFGPGFAIGGWFIPFANLVIPGMQMYDIWKGSGRPLRTGERAKGSALVLVWWIVFLLGRAFIFLNSTPSRSKIYDVSRYDVMNVLLVIASAATAASAVLAIFMIRAVTAMQEDGNAALMAGVGPGTVAAITGYPPPPPVPPTAAPLSFAPPVPESPFPAPPTAAPWATPDPGPDDAGWAAPQPPPPE